MAEQFIHTAINYSFIDGTIMLTSYCEVASLCLLMFGSHDCK